MAGTETNIFKKGRWTTPSTEDKTKADPNNIEIT
jgi:hypothetical protein